MIAILERKGKKGKKQNVEQRVENWIYTHQRDNSHSCAYDVGFFSSSSEAKENMRIESNKGYLCWGLKSVSQFYTLAK